MDFKMNYEGQDYEKNPGLSASSNEIQATSNEFSNSEIIQDFEMASFCGHENKEIIQGQCFYEDVQANFDESGGEINHEKRQKLLPQLFAEDMIPIKTGKKRPLSLDEYHLNSVKRSKMPRKPPPFFVQALKKKPNYVFAIVTDAFPYHGLSLKEVHSIKAEFLKKIDAIPLGSRFPEILNSSFYNGHFILISKNIFTNKWIINNFKENKKVIEGKSLVILNATDLSCPLDRIYSTERNYIKVQRLNFLYPVNISKSKYNSDSFNEKPILSTVKEKQTLCSNPELVPSASEETINFNKELSANDPQVISTCCTSEEQSCSNLEPTLPGSEETINFNKELSTNDQKAINSCTNKEQSCSNLELVHPGFEETINFKKELITNDQQAINSCYTKEEQSCSNLELLLPDPVKTVHFNKQLSINEQHVTNSCSTEDFEKCNQDQGKNESISNICSSTIQENMSRAFSLLNCANKNVDDTQQVCVSHDAQTKLTKLEILKLRRECLEELKHVKKLLKEEKKSEKTLLKSTSDSPQNIDQSESGNVLSKHLNFINSDLKSDKEYDDNSVKSSVLSMNLIEEQSPKQMSTMSQDTQAKLTIAELIKMRQACYRKLKHVTKLLKKSKLERPLLDSLSEKVSCYYRKSGINPCSDVGVQDCEQSKDVQENCVEPKKEKRGKLKSEISELLQQYKKKLKPLQKLLFENKEKQDNLNEQKNMAELEIRKLKCKYLKKIKQLKQRLTELKIKWKEDKKKKSSLKSISELPSTTNEANCFEETFRFDNSNSKHIKEIMKHSVITVQTPSLPQEKKAEIKRECIEKLDSFRVKFTVRHTNSDDNELLLSRLNRFNPNFRCLNWRILSKSIAFCGINWIFILKPFDIEALRKAKFFGYTGVERGIFRIVIGPTEISKLQIIAERRSRNINCSSGNRIGPIPSEEMDTSSDSGMDF